nr:S41 family peptidase [uncultured Chryseobacterium sp.]
MIKQIIIIFFLISTSTIFGQNTTSNLTKEERLKEVDLIRSTFVNLHPGIYRFNSPHEIENYFKNLKQKISKDINNEQYFILLSELTTFIKCGHTYLNPYNQTDETINNYFSISFMPFLYVVIDNKFIITHNLSENKTIKAGDEIISINGIKVKTIIHSLLNVSRADGNNGLGKKIDNLKIVPTNIITTNYSLFDIYFPLYFPKNFNTKNYSFVIKTFTHKNINTNLKSLTKKERQDIYFANFGAIPVNEKNWEFKFINKETAYLRLGDFAIWKWKDDYKKYLDSIFTDLHSSSAKNLIVDIRGNEGGDDNARTEVLSHLINKPFGCENQMRRLYTFLSVPDTLLPYLKTWDKEFKRPKNVNDYIKTPDDYYEKIDNSKSNCVVTYPKENVFDGEIFLLINSSNSSTTFIMSDIFQQTHTGKLIGETTGGTKKGINGGQFFFLNLPYSKLEIDIPLIWQTYIESRPDEGIIPDYEVRANQKDIHYGIDTQLKFILNKIDK